MKSFGSVLLRFRWLPLCIALLGAFMAYVSIPYGLGITSDSMKYLVAARSLRQGMGLLTITNEGTYATLYHFPPLLPLVLSVVPEPIPYTAIVFQITLLILSSLLVYALSRKTGLTKGISVLTQMSVTFSFQVLSVHSNLWSEPLFLVTTLGTVYLLTEYVNNGHKTYIILATLIASLTPLIRYSGFFLIPLVLAAFIFTRRKWSEGTVFITGVIIAILLALPSLFWLIMLSIEYLQPRSVAWHPPTISHLASGFTTVAGWIIPFPVPIILSAVLVTGTFAYVFFAFDRYFRKRKPAPALIILMAAMIAYAGIIMISIFLFDKMIPLDDRILVPVFIFMTIILGFLMSHPGLQTLSHVIICIYCLWTVTAVAHGSLYVRTSALHGQRSENETLIRSATIRAYDALPKDIATFSNCREALYAQTGQPVALLPHVDALERFTDNPGYIVYFKSCGNKEIVPIKTLSGLRNVIMIEQFDDGAIFEVTGGI